MQTSYDTAAPIAYAGMLADDGQSDKVTGLNEEGAALEFGVGVIQGTADDGIVLPGATGFSLKGVTIHDHRDNSGLAGGGGVADGDTVGVMRKGRIYVLPEQDVDPSDDVYLRFDPGGTSGGTVGHFRKDDDTDGTARADQITNARWVTTALAGEPVILEINQP